MMLCNSNVAGSSGYIMYCLLNKTYTLLAVTVNVILRNFIGKKFKR